MRLSRYTIPLSLALFCAGLAMFISAKNGQPNNPTGIDFGQPKHPITKAMEDAAEKMDRQPAPTFTRDAIKTGEKVTIGKDLERPQFVLFILDGCPCSIDAQPIYNDFSKHWAGKVDFVGVINDDAKKGREWVSDYRPIFPVVPDPEKEIIHAYKAQQSVYCALISTKGEIVKLWPGYSSEMMQEMNQVIAKEVGEETRKFDTKYVPREKTSGCYF